MGNIYKEINEITLKDLPALVFYSTSIKISGIKYNQQNKSNINKRVLVEIFSYYKNSVIQKTVTNDFGYYEFNLEKKLLPIGKYEIRYFGTGYRSELKPRGDWDIIEITKEMLVNGVSITSNTIGVRTLKVYSDDGEKTGTPSGEDVNTKNINLVWENFSEINPESFPLNGLTDYLGNIVSLSYEQALTMNESIVFMYVSNTVVQPPNDYPVDNIIPSRWVIVGTTKSSEMIVPLPSGKYVTFWVGMNANKNILNETEQTEAPLIGFDRKSY